MFETICPQVRQPSLGAVFDVIQ
jgi:hypothetical protein